MEAIDIAEQRFGKLVAKRRYAKGEIPESEKHSVWKCVCDCGNTKYATATDLRKGSVKSCGCLRKENPSYLFEDLTGKRFTRLTVLERAENTKNGQARWVCKCDCGKVKIVSASHLKSGMIKSCGCYHIDLSTKRLKKHGNRRTRIYRIWCDMKSRCYNKNTPAYRDYGKSGVIVCDEWRDDFQNFYDWSMKNGYADNLSIDRIDSYGNYEPSNCRWADAVTQANNKRNTKRITINGETHSAPEWSKITGIKASTINDRLRRGVEPEKLFEGIRKRAD